MDKNAKIGISEVIDLLESVREVMSRVKTSPELILTDFIAAATKYEGFDYKNLFFRFQFDGMHISDYYRQTLLRIPEFSSFTLETGNGASFQFGICSSCIESQPFVVVNPTKKTYHSELDHIIERFEEEASCTQLAAQNDESPLAIATAAVCVAPTIGNRIKYAKEYCKTHAHLWARPLAFFVEFYIASRCDIREQWIQKQKASKNFLDKVNADRENHSKRARDWLCENKEPLEREAKEVFNFLERLGYTGG